MKNIKTSAIISAILVSILTASTALAADYKLNLNNKTTDGFSIKKGLTEIGTLEPNATFKTLDLDKSDKLIFTSNHLPRFAIVYDQTNKRPRCIDISNYRCDVTSLPLSVFNISISK